MGDRVKRMFVCEVLLYTLLGLYGLLDSKNATVENA